MFRKSATHGWPRGRKRRREPTRTIRRPVPRRRNCSPIGWTKISPPRTRENITKFLILICPRPGRPVEPGALELLPDGRLALSTRLGEIWLIDRAEEKPPVRARFKLFASGLHEVLGLAWRDGWLYCAQRGEITRMKDLDGDGRADVFETVGDDWGINGDYHEYCFCSKFDREGYLWVALCLTGSFTSENPYRGWCLRVSPDGKVIPTCSGLRSPGGVGMNAEGDMFFTDNQGPWNGACALKHLAPGDFEGNPSGNM